MAEARHHAVAMLVLLGLAAVWAALAVLLGGGSPDALVFWALAGAGTAGSAAGSLMAVAMNLAAVRWVGIVGFGLGAAVCVLSLLLLFQA